MAQIEASQKLKLRLQIPPKFARLDEYADTEIGADACSMSIRTVLVKKTNGE